MIMLFRGVYSDHDYKTKQGTVRKTTPYLAGHVFFAIACVKSGR